MAASQALDSTTNNNIAESFTSSTRPIVNDQYSTPDQHSTTATMSDTNGKAPINGASAPVHDGPIVKVQPPRREDLQPSYARVIQPDDQDADTNGWYGSMVCLQIHHRHNIQSNRM
jgi:erythrocyte band 7 integral membrane protein